MVASIIVANRGGGTGGMCPPPFKAKNTKSALFYPEFSVDKVPQVLVPRPQISMRSSISGCKYLITKFIKVSALRGWNGTGWDSWKANNLMPPATEVTESQPHQLTSESTRSSFLLRLTKSLLWWGEGVKHLFSQQ